MSKKINVLFLPRHETSWRKLSDIAVFLEEDERFNSFILFANLGVEKFQSDCEKLNLKYMNINESINKKCLCKFNKLDKILDKYDDWLNNKDIIGASLLISSLRSLTLKKKLLVEYREFVKLLKAKSIQIVLLPGDRELSPIPSFIKAAKDCGIPLVNASLGSPYTEGLVDARSGLRKFKTKILSFPPVLNLIARYKYPNQMINTNIGYILFSPGWITFCLDKLGMLNPRPWVQGNNSDYLIQHCKHRVKEFVKRGVEENKIIMTGDPSIDKLYESYINKSNIKMEINKKYNILIDKPVVVVSVPNDAEHGVCSMKEHKARMDNYLSLLKDYNCTVLLSLHPKSNIDDYIFLKEKYNYIIIEDELSKILPIADLFICSVSSTILWAKICDVFTINLDYLNIQDADSDDVEMIETVKNENEFLDILKKYFIKNDNRFSSDTTKLVEIKKDYMFDGKSRLRICDFLSQVAYGKS